MVAVSDTKYIWYEAISVILSPTLHATVVDGIEEGVNQV